MIATSAFVAYNKKEYILGEEQTEMTENVKKRVTLMKWIRWAGIPLGVVMFAATEPAFGRIAAALLFVAASVSFFLICSGEGKRTMCQFVADDLKDAVTAAGLSRCIVEIKSINTGLITRIYLIRAGSMAARCNRAVVERIRTSWYRNSIWATQILELESEEELEEAQLFLDRALLEDIRSMREKKNEADSKADKDDSKADKDDSKADKDDSRKEP